MSVDSSANLGKKFLGLFVDIEESPPTQIVPNSVVVTKAASADQQMLATLKEIAAKLESSPAPDRA